MSGFIHLGEIGLIQMDETAHHRTTAPPHHSRHTAIQQEAMGALRERRANARVEVDVRLGLLEDLPQVAAYRVLGNVQ